MLGEATELILKLWSTDEPVSFTGKHFQVNNAVNTPRTVQRPHPSIWFGEARSNVLDLCARFGQGWNTTPAALPELKRRLGLLREACAREGRDYNEIEISVEMQILIAPDLDGVCDQLKAIADLAIVEDAGKFGTSLAASDEFQQFMTGKTDELPRVMAEEWIAGTSDQVEARIRAYLKEGVSHFMLWFQDAPSHSGMECFASEVAPRFR
jgi:alkanesulfonate monooxygenase SsuD/methylene tetrahydromethanopterin reductase-like flavin-dependent oxidoreductase (luciferase family)